MSKERIKRINNEIRRAGDSGDIGLIGIAIALSQMLKEIIDIQNKIDKKND